VLTDESCTVPAILVDRERTKAERLGLFSPAINNLLWPYSNRTDRLTFHGSALHLISAIKMSAVNTLILPAQGNKNSGAGFILTEKPSEASLRSSGRLGTPCLRPISRGRFAAARPLEIRHPVVDPGSKTFHLCR
jgi:hypothetical protein